MTRRTGRRVTIYVRPEELPLLEWAKQHTRKPSVSEAITAALEELRLGVRERRVMLLRQTQGMWAHDEGVEEAFRELEEGWARWGRRLEGS